MGGVRRITLPSRGKGRLKQVPYNVVITLTLNGYQKVELFADSKSHTRLVHRLVALAFLANPYCKPHVAHSDGDKENNCVENLRWATAFENENDKLRHGTRLQGEKIHTSKLNPDLVREIRDLRDSKNISYHKIADMFGIAKSTCMSICKRRTWRHVQ